jgi:hypothetical protein
MRLSHASVLLVAALCAACERAPSAPAGRLLDAVEPSLGLSAIDLPQSIAEIQARRPRAVRTPGGLQESVPPGMLSFSVNRFSSDSALSDEPVRAIELGASFATDDSARMMWDRYRRTWDERLGATGKCYASGPLEPASMFVRWSIDSGVPYLTLRLADSIPTGAGWVQRRPVVTIGVQVDSLWIGPLMEGKVATDCA